MPVFASKEEAVDLYSEKGLSFNQISKLRGVHSYTVQREIEAYGIPTRKVKTTPNPFDYVPDRDPVLDAFGLGFWAGEGTKNGKKVEATNCAPRFLRRWRDFLIEVCGVDPAKMKLRIQIHNPESREAAIAYWHEQLGMKLDTSIHVKKHKAEVEKQPMGTATLGYNSVGLRAAILARLDEAVGAQA